LFILSLGYVLRTTPVYQMLAQIQILATRVTMTSVGRCSLRFN